MAKVAVTVIFGVTANITVTATFAINTYTLTYTAGSGGTIRGTTPQTVNYGSNGTQVTAVPSAGYTWASWSDSYATAARTDTGVTANKAVTATFAMLPLNTPSLSGNAGAGIYSTYYTFTASISGGLAPYTYAFTSDGTPAAQSGSSTTYQTYWTSAGTKTINVRITDSLGQYKDASTTIVIYG